MLQLRQMRIGAGAVVLLQHSALRRQRRALRHRRQVRGGGLRIGSGPGGAAA
ncbi:hypothetical protein NRY95_16835 [Xanthomonas campestris pv. phormiicola]|nr:hypothetical protein NRY95_16835 [Xanthomonas campestris pv. phormiicola]